MLIFANVVWGARCGESARRVLLGETRSRGYVHSVRHRRESASGCKAPHGLPSSRLVSTIPFDEWMKMNYPSVPFERYADDILCHCWSEREAHWLRRRLQERFASCRLRLHPQKTKVVYCKDSNRSGLYPVISFDFLGYTFRPRLVKWPRGTYGVSFQPAASQSALQAIRKSVRLWGLQRRSEKDLGDLARMFSPYIRGWVNYYSHFYKSALYPTLKLIDEHLVLWVQRKCKRLRQRPVGARVWLASAIRRYPMLFPHWKLLYGNGRMLGAG
ncbi:group II intron maturase-specific domain-containing protein [Steroidobacter flavus]|uniref:Group II intron maturase-specific domain-containing protein n=1 Tax=Steroidobacter flavus TaxID=1842136 RepID=A0ABV8SYB4_9GAMM